ncbi:MAG: LysM peptidoglycan-binding domain-containing protein [Tissierellia bacterium]|nr:LysM peptidoglycan-binding domain-containing protein [Tissierellia bacterium]
MYIHVVSSGEVLWQIANYYNANINDIIIVNGLQNPNQLLVGQSLLIPTDENIYYTVKPGDSAWTIANKYDVPIYELLWSNRIMNPNLLYPGMVLNIPQRPKPIIEVNAFTYVLGENAVPLVREVGDLLTFLSPFAYVIKEDGGLQGIQDDPAIRAANLENVIPVMSVINFTITSKGENLAHIVLNNPQIIDNLQVNILNIMKQKGYRGVNIDFENVLPEDREAYNNFLESTVDRFHREGYFVSTSLAPKISGEQIGLLYEAHDYEAHGRLADFVVLMTYEWGYRAGPPQAISPINEIRRVLDYAITVIPRNKILMGFQIYARDWLIPHIPGQEAETISIQEAMDIAYKHYVTIEYDSVAESPYFHYIDEMGRTHEVWFEDARSAQAKFNTVVDYNLRGISYWALGYPFPQNWALLEDSFNILKRNNIK